MLSPAEADILQWTQPAIDPQGDDGNHGVSHSDHKARFPQSEEWKQDEACQPCARHCTQRVHAVNPAGIEPVFLLSARVCADDDRQCRSHEGYRNNNQREDNNETEQKKRALPWGERLEEKTEQRLRGTENWNRN